MDSSVRLPQMQDPNAYANYYAQQNNMTVDEAKEELKAQYGDPQKPQDVSSLFPTQEEPIPIASDIEFSDEEYEEIFGAETTSNPIANFFNGIMDFFGKGDEDSVGKRQDPDVQAQEYADANGLTLDEAKEELKEKYGEPEEKEEEQE